ncbi:MAG: NFACT family protein [Clostridia bacterium]|nr:NFACT family protein [Clostridia bacterium]
MPTDAITLCALARELNDCLAGGRIDKVYQPESDEITLLIRAKDENRTLVLSANPSLPRLHFTKTKKENPQNAPAFCMLLRKYLTSARILSVDLFNNDRIIRFTLTSKSEMMDDMTLRLYFELMGRYSNVILTLENDKILDVLRRVPLDMSHTRRLLPSFTYEPPKNDKISIFDKTALSHVLEYVDKTEEEILNKVSGISRESARELIFRASASNNFSQTFIQEVEKLSSPLNPCFSLDKNGSAQDFFSDPYLSSNKAFQKTESLNEAVDRCFADKDLSNRIKSKAKHLTQSVKSAVQRVEKKLGVNLQKLQDCERAEEYRIKGELITANIYRIQKGSEGVVLQNYYDENKDIKVSLDPTKTPSQNAQNYYKKYVKLKRTKETVVKMIEENREILDYLKCVSYDVESATRESDLKDIEETLVDAGIITKKVKGKKVVEKPSLPIKYLYKDTEILVGRNNLQNDRLTFKTALKSDTWLHVKNYHGSHVIVKGAELSPDVLQFSAELAAFYSEAKTADKVEVDYTKIKNVHRSPQKRLGLVLYTDFSSVVVKPNEHKEYIK